MRNICRCRDRGAQRVLGRVCAHPEPFPTPDFCLCTWDGWRSRQIVSGSFFIALYGSNCEAKLSPWEARRKIPSAQELFTHQIFFDFWISLFNPKDTGGEMESEASVKTSYENKCLYSGTWCVLPRAGMRDHTLRGATGGPWPRSPGSLRTWIWSWAVYSRGPSPAQQSCPTGQRQDLRHWNWFLRSRYLISHK